MKIFYFGVYNNFGGLETYSKNLISGIKKIDDRINFHIISTSNDFSYKQTFLDLKCEISIIPSPYKHPLKFYLSLMKILKSASKEDIFHINICSFRNSLLFLAAKRSKIKCVVVGHNSDIFSRGMVFLHKINRFYFRNLGLFIAVSQEVKNFMFYKKRHVKIIYNGINSELYSYNDKYNNEIRNQYNLHSNDIVLGMVARISKEKNQTFAIDVLKELLNQYKNVKLLLVGKENECQITNYVSDKNVKNNVVICGQKVTNVYKFYSAIDIYLFPSISEGFPISRLEALASGLEIISSIYVPKLANSSIDKNILYLSLDKNIWVEELSKRIEIIEKENNDKNNSKITKRKNILKGTEFEIDTVNKAYIEIYYSFS